MDVSNKQMKRLSKENFFLLLKITLTLTTHYRVITIFGNYIPTTFHERMLHLIMFKKFYR